VQGPSPTPTPTISPTPTPGIGTPTPTPTITPIPTPTPMATAVPETERSAQFLFAASPSSGFITGFRINHDGSLAPVAGSPFASQNAAHVAALDNLLMVAGKTGIKLYSVDKESGAILQTDAIEAGPVSELLRDPATNAVVAVTPGQRLLLNAVKGKLQALPAGNALSGRNARVLPPAVLDASGRFMFAVDSTEGVVNPYRVDGQKLVRLPASYPVAGPVTSIALVRP